jgi:hypothetical protein
MECVCSKNSSPDINYKLFNSITAAVQIGRKRHESSHVTNTYFSYQRGSCEEFKKQEQCVIITVCGNVGGKIILRFEM